MSPPAQSPEPGSADSLSPERRPPTGNLPGAPPGALVSPPAAGLDPEWSVGEKQIRVRQVWGLRVCVSNTLPAGTAALLAPEPHLSHTGIATMCQSSQNH